MESDKDDCIVFEQNNIFSQGLPVLEEIRRQGKFCDITLKVDGLSFKAHKIILSAIIPYFYSMFTLDMLESREAEVTIQGIEAQTLESIINFSYSGKIIIDIRTAQSLMAGASYLQMTQLKEACAGFLSERLQVCNALGLRKFADTLSCSVLVEACEKYIQQYFLEVSLCDEFSDLSVEEVAHLLSNDELHVSSEEQVFNALIRWIKKDRNSRKEHLPHLLALIRLPLLSPECLTDKIAKEELIKSSHECRDLVDEAKDYYLIPERRYLLANYKHQLRCCRSITGLIFAIGGLTESGESLATVESYDPMVGDWSLTEPMTTVRSRVGVGIIKKHLFAIGGYDGTVRLNTVEVFDSDTKAWFNVSSMQFSRSAGGAADLKDKLYVCGGYDGSTSLDSVECYHPELNIWSMVTSMVKQRSACGVVPFDGNLYALGGHDGLTIFDQVERFDPNTGIWTEITPMLTKRCRLGVASLNGKLYACGGYDGSKFLQTVEMYDPKRNLWQMVAPMNTKRSRVALVVNMGELWAIGGYDGVSNLSTVEIYNPKLDKWVFGPSMHAHSGGVGVGVIPLS